VKKLWEFYPQDASLPKFSAFCSILSEVLKMNVTGSGGDVQIYSLCPLPLITRSSAIAEGPRDASCQLKSCQLPRNSVETTYTTSPDQIDGMKLEI